MRARNLVNTTCDNLKLTLASTQTGGLSHKADTPVARKSRENKLEVELTRKDDSLRAAATRIEQLSVELINSKEESKALEEDNSKLVEL